MTSARVNSTAEGKVVCCTGDGLLTAVRLEAFEVLDQRAILFNDCADRVALLLRLRLRGAPPARCKPGSLVRAAVRTQMSARARSTCLHAAWLACSAVRAGV